MVEEIVTVPPLYRVSAGRRFAELLVRPWLGMAGAAMVIYTIVKVAPLLGQAREFLSRGWVAWVAAAPAALILTPFLLLFGWISLRSVLTFWVDAVSTATVTLEGAVTFAKSQPYAYVSGRAFVSGTSNQLTVAGKLFASLPTEVIKRIQIGDRVRIVYTPRVNYVVELVLLP